ncbi:MAG: ATP-dependent DNA helicase RecG [Burkholderiales bacterium]|jgi:ATP-dependent DNA helicase RecG|nr:ATP-dependent DNA helicase RecG [Burkholderiales bacterium]
MPHSKDAKSQPVKPAKDTARDTLATKLARLAIQKESDLTLHLPMRYEDHTKATPMTSLVAGQHAVVEGNVTASEVQYKPRRQWICVIEDEQKPLMLRFFTYYPNQQKALAIGKRVRAIGEVREGYYGLEMVHPMVTVLSSTAPPSLPEKLTPVYPTTAGLSQQTLIKRIQKALLDESLIQDELPEVFRVQEKLWGWKDALLFLHAPPSLSQEEYRSLLEGTHPAATRVKFDELLTQQLSLKLHRKNRARFQAFPFKGTNTLVTPFLESLPFSLTAAQKRVWSEIDEDLKRALPMNRLLEGDVGSGKTVIAALAALRAIEEKKQVALMAPTEILAEQHYRKLSAWLARLNVRVVWLTGSLSVAERNEAQKHLASGEPMLVIGTHALFQEQVSLPNLGLAIVDEQHRFGVVQRLALRNKGKGKNDSAPSDPHVVHQLMMSATPIPRTLAMSFYADLDVSVIDERPAGRGNIVTHLVNQSRREVIIERIGTECAAGAQAYWVCPLVEESEHLSLVAAETLFGELSAIYNGNTKIADKTMPRLHVGLLHGKLKPAEKTATMEAFLQNKIQVLVATTVIEVGVDVANARLMVIEHAERFGLAQLHQLRGRVGRGKEESRCFLLYETPLSLNAKARLKAVYENNDGFMLAREDLKQRGPGEFLGARQSGLPMLRYADPERDEAVLWRARYVADQLLEMPTGETIAAALISRWLGNSAAFFDV